MAIGFEAFDLSGKVSIEIGDSDQALVVIRRSAQSANTQLEKLEKQAVATAAAFRQLNNLQGHKVNAGLQPSPSARTPSRVSSGGDSAMRRAQADIARMQSQRVKWESDYTNHVARQSEQQYRARVSSYQKGLREFQQTLNQQRRAEASQSATAKSSGGGSLFASVTGGNIAAQVITQVTSAAVDGGRAILEYSASLEQTKVGFETLMGSAQLAQSHLNELQQFAKSTPFEFAGLAKMSQRLQGVGVESQKVIPLINDIGNAVAAVGGSAEQVEGVTVAISQMISKGKVSAEEMEQLAERQVNGWAMLSAELGISQGAVRKLASEGKISTDVFLKAFQNFSRANFGDAMEKQSKTFNGALSNIKDSIQISAASAFEPLFAKVRGLAVDMAKDIEAQNGDFEKIGVVIAEYMGKGLALGVEAIAGSLGGYLGNRLTGIFSGEAIIDPMTKAVVTGFFNGIGKALDSATAEKKFNFKVESGINLNDSVFKFKDSKGAVNEYTKALDKLKGSWKEALEAASEDKLKRQKELMLDVAKTVGDLALKVSFFGDESEVSAVKQQFLSKGISDFNSGLAKNAIAWAGQLDAMKKAKKEQEDLADKTKDFYSKLNDFSESALDIFPQTELDKFDRWLSRVDAGLNNIKSNADGVRSRLQAAFDLKTMIAGFEVFGTLDAGMDILIKDADLATAKISELDQAVINLARSANVIGGLDFRLGNGAVETSDIALMGKASQFLKEYTANMDKLAQRRKEIKDAENGGVDPTSLDIFYGAADSAFRKKEDEIKARFKTFLQTLKTTVIVEGKAVEQALFSSDAAMESFITKYLKLGKSLENKKLAEEAEKTKKSFESLDSMVAGLGGSFTTLEGKTLGVKTELQGLNEYFANPENRAGIEEYAKALGYTGEQLKNIIRQLQEGKAQIGNTRPRVVGAQPQQPGFGDTVSAGLSAEFGLGNIGRATAGAQDEMTARAAATKAVYQDLGNTVVDVFGSMAGAAEGALANFILTGEGGAAAFASLAASAIASLAIQSGIKSIFEFAEAGKESALALASAAVGDAAGAALHTAAAAAHVSAGTMYAAIAGGAAAVGLGIGLAGGLGGGGGSASSGSGNNNNNQPDYYTADNPPPQEKNAPRYHADPTTLKLMERIEALNNNVGGLRESVTNFDNKIGSMKEGEVLTRGIKQKRGLLSDTVMQELKGDGSKTTQFGKTLRQS